MKTNMFNPRSHGTAGPGGWDCPCCGPAPKHRRLFARLFKKRLYRDLNRELNKEIREDR